MRIFLAIILSFASSLLAQAQSQSQKHPFTFEDMMKLKRVGAPVPSPDGKWVVFDCEDVDLAANKKTSHLWIVPASGGESRRLNPTPNHEERPRFSADGKRLIWTSKATDPTQIWMCDFDPERRRARRETASSHINLHRCRRRNLVAGRKEHRVRVSGLSGLQRRCMQQTARRRAKEEQGESESFHAIVLSALERVHGIQTQPFVCGQRGARLRMPRAGASRRRIATTAGARPSASACAADLTPGDHDVPPFSLGGQDMYTISPDGQEVAYTSNIDEVEATSTNNEIFVVPISGGTPKKISTSPGSDTTPLYSPDGKYLAWRSQARAGFEADKWRLLVQDRQSGNTRDLTEKFDRSVGSFAWGATTNRNRNLLYVAEDSGDATHSRAVSE